VDDKALFALRQEITELQVALVRKRSEVSNLTVGYTRAEEGVGAIPPDPLRRNLVTSRAELLDLERRLGELERQLELETGN
jgi:hypothetical protein